MDYKDTIIKLFSGCGALCIIALLEYCGAYQLLKELKNGTD